MEKKHFQKNLIYFRIFADFEADNEIDNSNIGNKTTDINKQTPECNGYYIVSELDDILKNGYLDPLSGIKKVDWFVEEVIKLEKKMFFYFTNTNKDIIRSQEKDEDYRNINICRFCEKEIISDKVSDHCHLTGKYKGPAHNKCNNNVTQ